MAVPVWRLEKAEIQYSDAKRLVYHDGVNCQYPGRIKGENLVEDPVDKMGQSLVVTTEDGEQFILSHCLICSRQTLAEKIEDLLREVLPLWKRFTK